MRRNKSRIKVNKSYYHREIPCDNNINLAFWLLYHFSNIDKNELSNGLIGAYLLTWYKQGYINIKNDSNKDDNNYVIDLKTGKWKQSYFEKYLYNFLRRVAGNNNILERNELRRYCSVDNNRNQFYFLIEYALCEVELDLEAKKKIDIINKNSKKYKLSLEMENEYKKLIGLKNFLSDFSNIEEKKHIQVHLWEVYLIFANILGIADKVKKQFSKIYSGKDYNNIFDVSFDGTLANKFTALYNILKLNLFVIIGFILLIIFSTFGLELFYLFIFILFVFGYFIYRYWVNKKVKEMNGKMYAKITKVFNKYDVLYDGSEFIIKTYHLVDYEYNVGKIVYEGSDCFQSLSTPRVGDKIKIYYNLVSPLRSESAINHNKYLKVAIALFIILLIIIYVCCLVYL